tara:strand:+ start:116 stop:1183 length:1068 start_codon:yes stop_codon:yes gene_type:complete
MNNIEPSQRPFSCQKRFLGSLLSILGVLALVALSPLQGEESVKKGYQEQTYDFKAANEEIEYALYVPRSYKKTAKTPLIVLLHGLGSKPQEVIQYAGIIPEAEKRGYIVVAPYGYNSRGWYGASGKGRGFIRPNPSDPENLGELSEKDVLNVIKIVRDDFSIDESRMYLMGHSMGGGGTVHLGTKFPELWAGLAPLAPAIMSGRDKLGVLKKNKIPIMIVTGDKDRLIPVTGIRSVVDKLKAEGITHLYKEIKDGNHGSSIHANPSMIAEVFDFFDKHSKAGESEPDADGSDEKFREFTNTKGQQIKAKVVSITGTKVTIIREDGRRFTMTISTLSEPDQAFIEAWKKKYPKKVR